MKTSVFTCCIIICCIACLIQAELHVNTFMYMSYTYAKDANVSSCWVCTHIPIHSKGGIPLQPIPFNESEMAEWVLYNGARVLQHHGEGRWTIKGRYFASNEGNYREWESSGYTLSAFQTWHQPSYDHSN